MSLTDQEILALEEAIANIAAAATHVSGARSTKLNQTADLLRDLRDGTLPEPKKAEEDPPAEVPETPAQKRAREKAEADNQPQPVG